MTKKLLAASLALSTLGAMAQMPDNSICPDWNGTDLNGNSYNLYSLLDSGYTVFIDVSATWCGPCWSYHNTHALKNLYETYGPGTAQNKVRVFFIEGDASTTLADLQGTGSNTQGNWVAGTTYPIIDNASIGSLLQITYFPTIYKVCPSRLITEIGQKTTAQLWASVSTCQSAVNPSDGTLLPALAGVKTCQGSGVDLAVRLQNMGTTPMTSATIEARSGTTVLGSTNWTGNLATYGVTNVTVTNYVPPSSGTITYQITSPDDNGNNNSSIQAITTSNTVAPSTDVTFEIKTDNYGSETRWKLFRPDGSIFAQAGPYTNGANLPAHTYQWALQDLTCYRLEVYDGYGDGMCCSYGQGYYKVMVNGSIVLQGAQFTSSDVKLFKTDAATAGIEGHTLGNSLNIYPNPTTGLVNVDYNLDQSTSLKAVVTDVVGKTVMTRDLRSAAGAQHQTLDLSNLGNGMYLITLDAGDRHVTRTITLNK